MTVKIQAQQQGMTLIELMIVVAIIGIISAIAYPSYTSYVQDTRRAVAQGDLLELAQSMERYFTANSTYVGATLAFNQSPRTSQGYYNLALVAAATTYTITAAPILVQVSADCKNLTIDQIGNKAATDTNDNLTGNCWR